MRRGTGDRRIRVHGLAGLSAAAVVALGVLYAVAVRTRWGQELDETALLGRYVTEGARGDVDTLLATISIASLAFAGIGIVAVGLLRRRPWLALSAGAVIACSVATTEVLKRLLPRSDLLGLQPDFGGPSYPSGHTTVAFSLAVAATLVVPRNLRNGVAAAGLVYAVAVGIAVVSAGWHRPSDVYGAYLVVTAWAAAAAAVLVSRRGTGDGRDVAPMPADSQRGRTGAVLVLAGIVLLALAALAAATVVLLQRRDGFDQVGPAWEFAIAGVAITAVAAGLTGLLLGLLRGISLDVPAAAGGFRDVVSEAGS